MDIGPDLGDTYTPPPLGPKRTQHVNRRYLLAGIAAVLVLAIAFILLLAPPHLHPVTINGRAGYINQKGKLIIQPQFETAGEFSEGLAPVRTAGKWGYVNRQGTLTIPPQFDMADPFSKDGLALVASAGKLGFI
jgi:hypothetical protein